MIERLRQLAGDDAVREGSWTPFRVHGREPQVVVTPSTAEQAAAVLRTCTENDWTVEPAGAGTWLDWGRPPDHVDVLLSAERLAGVTDYAPADLTISVAAGTPLAEVSETVSFDRQMLGFDPPARPGATIGATIATASAGPLRLSVGTPRDQVLGLEVVTGDGRIVRLGGRVVKNVAGYDLVRLLVGSRGTLGFITQAHIRLRPAPEHEITALFVSSRVAPLLELALGPVTRTWPAAIELFGPATSSALGLERLASARARLQEAKPQTRAELLLRWLDEAVKPGRVVGIGRSGRRLVMVTQRQNGNVIGIREDGRRATFPLQRIGRVYAPVYSLREAAIENAFEEIHARGRELVVPEPRLRDAHEEEVDALNLIEDAIEALLANSANEKEKKRCTEALWATLADAEVFQRATQGIERLREEVWLPFEQRARILASFGYLDFDTEKVTERGRWLADLHIDRPLIVGEALESGLFKTLDHLTMTAIVAALTADEDRDYGEIELDDNLVSNLVSFEDIGFRVSSEEWKYGVEPAPELNFSAAGAASRWAGGDEWTTLVRETRAEEGDLFRMLSRTGEALLQIAGLRRAHPEAARTASVAAEVVLREPLR